MQDMSLLDNSTNSNNNSNFAVIDTIIPQQTEALEGKIDIKPDTLETTPDVVEVYNNQPHTVNTEIKEKVISTDDNRSSLHSNQLKLKNSLRTFSKTAPAAIAASIVGARVGTKNSKPILQKIYDFYSSTFSDNAGIEDIVSGAEYLAQVGISKLNNAYNGNFVQKILKLDSCIESKYRRVFGNSFSKLDNLLDTKINNLGSYKYNPVLKSGLARYINSKINLMEFHYVDNGTNELEFVAAKFNTSMPKWVTKFASSDLLKAGTKWLGRIAVGAQIINGTYETYKAVDNNGGLVNNNGQINKKGAAAGIVEGSKQLGGLACGWLGAKVGAALLSPVLPPVGTLVGGVIGGIVGYMAGKSIGKDIGKTVVKYGKTVLKTTTKALLLPLKASVNTIKAVGKGIKRVANGIHKVVNKIAAHSKLVKTTIKYGKKVIKSITRPVKKTIQIMKIGANKIAKGAMKLVNKVTNKSKAAKAVVNTTKSAAKKVLKWLGL